MATLPTKPNCRVCEQNPSKYKCPNCTLPYCSLPCYKKHKETPCEKPVPSAQVPGKTKYSAASTAADEDSETALRDEQLRKLATSDKLRDFLRYPQIRALIAEIDGGADPEVLLDRARENDPVFAEFAEEALDTVLGSWRGQEDA
ncbi:zinc finger HIT domain-containing protein 3-like protein [Jimgerdemannia flammicorona]|uniref:Zinc finger HIT domain-containing protein 3 n=1 Tax=Jimgerdemannia flammicorona TaxID=994334 RepID=A0A433Q6N7_9FUNG|nr:zinc finger HIT domain-containing protein 3-like protein [Jimgerdemannia flammicorona]